LGSAFDKLRQVYRTSTRESHPLHTVISSRCAECLKPDEPSSSASGARLSPNPEEPGPRRIWDSKLPPRRFWMQARSGTLHPSQQLFQLRGQGLPMI
ncbi:unnamed protein product, partial [Mycena citricolor]